MLFIRVTDKLGASLGRLATAIERSRSWHAVRALEAYLKTELAFVETVEEGLADLEADRVTEHDEVAADLRRRFGRSAA